MKSSELLYANLTQVLLQSYKERAPTDSARFLRWFLENIFRMEAPDADDAVVDSQNDKGVDGIFMNDTLEVIYIAQAKVRQNDNAKPGDTDLKEFIGTLKQFENAESVLELLKGQLNNKLKWSIERNNIIQKLNGGYSVEGIFCCNVDLNDAGSVFAKGCENLTVYDGKKIAEEYVELDAKSGIEKKFTFDVSDTDVIKYLTSNGVKARIFLAGGLQLTHMSGIADQTLFSQNVRLSLGNSKVNKSLRASLEKKGEHTNFPLYHNGITVLCRKIVADDKDSITIEGYMVVNGAQSLTSLLNSKAKISNELRLVVRIVELGDDGALSDRITINSNNQNAIKARDLKSNNPVQERLKKEVEKLDYNDFRYEVKRGEVHGAKTPISNEDAGLALLAMDLGEPWACHQRYKVMDESHARIFGRVDVTGAKILALREALQSCLPALKDLDDQVFAHYNLTKYFLAYSVAEILKSEPSGRELFVNFEALFAEGKLDGFLKVYGDLASTTINDLNAEVSELEEGSGFDYKKDLKSPNWCRTMVAKLRAAYLKDVKRRKAVAVEELIVPLL